MDRISKSPFVAVKITKSPRKASAMRGLKKPTEVLPSSTDNIDIDLV